jgi:hypothetical protein
MCHFKCIRVASWVLNDFTLYLYFNGKNLETKRNETKEKSIDLAPLRAQKRNEKKRSEMKKTGFEKETKRNEKKNHGLRNETKKIEKRNEKKTFFKPWF